MITSRSRGWDIVFKDGKWLYVDTLETTDIERHCKKCGRFPTPEGYDACLGYIPGVTSVCCGHGNKEDKIIIQQGSCYNI